jgi:hypothetical protein
MCICLASGSELLARCGRFERKKLRMKKRPVFFNIQSATYSERNLTPQTAALL